MTPMNSAIRRAGPALGLAALLTSAVFAQGGYTAPECPFRDSPSYPGLPGVCHPYSQPRPPLSLQRHYCLDDGSPKEVLSCADCPESCLTRVHTGESVFPAYMRAPRQSPYSSNVPPPVPGSNAMLAANPFNYLTFPGTNFLPNVYTNMYDGGGVEMANTLPSTPDIPYNLHPDPIVSEVNPTSPEDDLFDIIHSIQKGIVEIGRLRATLLGSPPEVVRHSMGTTAGEIDFHARDIGKLLGLGIDILEGNSLADSRLATRAYDGFPMLHYKGPEKIKKVEPILDEHGSTVGGDVTVHQIWFGQHVESDTAFLDPSEVLQVPWTVTYVIDTLNRGHDDFSPFATFTETPWFHTTYDEMHRWQPGDYCTIGGPAEDRRSAGCERLPWQFVKGTQTQHGYGTPCVEPKAPGDPWQPPEFSSGECGGQAAPPGIGMDQTFFNMEEGTRTVFKIGMPPGDYLNLVYTWGWRMHPPRIQVMESALKKPTIQPEAASFTAPGPHPDGICPSDYTGCALPQLEQAVFCNPDNSMKYSKGDKLPDGTINTCSIPDLPVCTSVTDQEIDKEYAIGRIGDLSPAKRMWKAFKEAETWLDAFDFDWKQQQTSWATCESEGHADCVKLLEYDSSGDPLDGVDSQVGHKAFAAYEAWIDRTELPCFERDPNAEHGQSCRDGLNPDPESDITVLYVNNTLYGQLTAGGWVRWPNWETRFASWQKSGGPPESKPVLKVTLHNDDHFPHAYNLADFGGSRGWENQFKSSVKVAGSGCWFTFGRAHWWINTGKGNGFVCAPPAADREGAKPTTRHFEIQFNFEPSRRLRFYQFDPFHHDVAIYSVH